MVKKHSWRRGFSSTPIDKNRCEICGIDIPMILEIHHIIPISKWGSHSRKNLVVLCKKHHRAVHRGEISLDMEGEYRIDKKLLNKGGELMIKSTLWKSIDEYTERELREKEDYLFQFYKFISKYGHIITISDLLAYLLGVGVEHVRGLYTSQLFDHKVYEKSKAITGELL